ncbi:phosphatidylinositol N-acetylglucosaminyltransferase subunit C-like [Amphiura filiformis]|uniref:phosphatidylinositol N-acetylglucosaminyltransferase subunit C-like n=1 Tax=Amphiura filiformis TaxID=82378 RepID=UPI003B212DED
MVKRKWHKVLYMDQGVPDNYVDKSFLDEMKKNVNTRTYELWSVIRETGVVSQQLSSICFFVVIFIYMDSAVLTPSHLLTVSSIVTVLGYILYDLVDWGAERRKSQRSRAADVKTTLIFMTFTYGLSPILQTLTDTISTDTIYAMTVFMLLGSLLFHDYGTDAIVASRSLSLNASVFASVCLASRLPTSMHTFATVTLAMQLFALWPELRRKLKRQLPNCQYIMTWGSASIALASLLSISTSAGVCFALVHLAITYLVPLCLISLQPYKNNIHGPWDEAVIQH